MKAKIEATAKDLRHTQKGSPYTGIRIEGIGWVNLYGDHRGKQGQVLNITEPKTYSGGGDSKWASIEKVSDLESSFGPPPSSSTPAPPPPNTQPDEKLKGFERTIQQYMVTMDLFHLHIKKLEPDSAEARAALINNAMILWTEGKIV